MKIWICRERNIIFSSNKKMINYTSREKICFLGKNSFVVEVTFKLCIELISNQDQDQPI